MFNASFIGSIMNMKADVYVQQNNQNADTGAVERTWLYTTTLNCKIEPIKSGGASTRGDNKQFDHASIGGYAEKLQLRMKTTELLSKRWRIQNVKSSDGQSVFVEMDRIGDPDMIFEVFSSHAVLDPFGKINYYEAVLQRVPVQTDAKTDHRL